VNYGEIILTQTQPKLLNLIRIFPFDRLQVPHLSVRRSYRLRKSIRAISHPRFRKRVILVISLLNRVLSKRLSSHQKLLIINLSDVLAMELSLEHLAFDQNALALILLLIQELVKDNDIDGFLSLFTVIKVLQFFDPILLDQPHHFGFRFVFHILKLRRGVVRELIQVLTIIVVIEKAFGHIEVQNLVKLWK